MERIDQQLIELKTIEENIKMLGEKKEVLRKDIFGYIEDNGLTDGYKNDVATVSYVERKTVNIKNQEELFKDLEKQKLVKYYELIPKKIIPAHAELKAEFTKDVKDGKFEHPQIEVEVKSNLAVKFN